MQTLEDVVDSVIESMVQDEVLFTGLDVSNKVKETLPLARHSEVSELVRQKFQSHIEPFSYAKTPINVTLRDGSVRTALLYHPLTDAWDLDNKYDAQKRSQVANKPAVASNTAPVPASVSANGTVTVSPPASAMKSPVIPTLSPAAAWAQLFNSQPSLFPRK